MLRLVAGALLCASFANVAAAQEAKPAATPAIKPAHGIAMHGDLKYPANFKHFDYVNPNAPKGGTLRLSDIGTFDTLNGFVLRGVAAEGIGLMYDTLMTASADEAFSQYCLLCETVEVPPDRSWVIFNLRAAARFQDGQPVTADDVVFTFDIIRAKGHPQLRFYYASIAKVEKLGERRVKFTFKPGENRELPLIIGQQPILPKHYWETRDFERATVEPPVGSGPYKIESFEPGRDITYRRDPNYWGRNLPVNVGRYNFAAVRYDYYRDQSVEFEAFKAGQYDFRAENTARNWAIGYDFPALRRGEVKKEELENHRPMGMQGYVYNTRRPLFADPRVRRALAYAFDFEWTNKRLFYGAYTRSESYFSNSELAATGLPQGEELALLEKHRAALPPEVFTTPYFAPKTDGSGMARDNLLTALTMLEEAGWKVRPEDGIMVDTEGNPVSFEILLIQPAFERVSSPFVRNLKRLGIQARVRTVDTAQYKNRLDNWDFDMVVGSWGQSSSPGNEQRDFWSSSSADTPGGRNLAGIKNPVIDDLIDLIIAAPDRESLVARTRALDRVLLWGHYVIPNWYVKSDRVAYWNKFEHPSVTPDAGYQIFTWWVDPSRETAVAQAKEQAASESAAEQQAKSVHPPDDSPRIIYIVVGLAAAVLLLIALRRLRRPTGSRPTGSRSAPLDRGDKRSMFAYIIRRLLLIIPTLFGIMLINFAIVQFAPGGPVEQMIAQLSGTAVNATARFSGGGGGELATSSSASSNERYRGAQGLDPNFVKEIEKLYGFDKPAPERFWLMMKQYVQLDFGRSFFRDRSVVELVLEKMPVSISLGLWTTLLIYLISIPLGIAKAMRDGSSFDIWTSVAVIIGNAVPGFLFAILLVVLFAGGSYFNWFPLRGLVSPGWSDMSWPARIADYFWHMALPLGALVIGSFANLTMLTKNSFLEEINKQYVMTARAKGLTEHRVLYGHVFRNAMLIVVAGFPSALIGILFTGALLIEVIFSLDGLGLLGYEAVINRDYPVVFGTLFFFSLIGLVFGLIRDVTYILVDPRIDFEARG